MTWDGDGHMGSFTVGQSGIARNGDDVLEHLQELTPQRASQIGQAAYRRISAHHTYSHRATQLEELWGITPQLASSNSLERAANG